MHRESPDRRSGFLFIFYRMRILSVFLFLIVYACPAANITDIICINEQPLLYQKLELAIAIDYKAPDTKYYFDPNKIAIEAHFTSPSGKQLTVYGFYFIDHSISTFPYQRLATWHPWRVRFCPNESGQWTYFVKLIENDSLVSRSTERSFECKISEEPGYIHTAANKRFLEFDNGKSFFGVGMDMQAYGTSYEAATFIHYNYWIPRFAREGGNLTRIWMRPSDYELECDTLGLYRMDKAYELDKVFELFEKYHIYANLVLLNPEQLSQPKSLWGSWEQNRYRDIPLKKNKEFFSNKKALQLFKNKLRYIQARWGYSTSLLSYEICNEIDHIDKDFSNDPAKVTDPLYFNKTDQEAVAKWINLMSDHLKTMYPRHLTNISMSNGCNTAFLKKLSTDITNAHNYSAERYVEYQRNYMAQKNIVQLNKPFLMTEYGEDHRPICWIADKNNLSYHNGLWSGLFSGAASGYLFFNSASKFYNDKWADTLVGKSWLAAQKFLANEVFNEPTDYFLPIGNTRSAYNYFTTTKGYKSLPYQLGKKAPPDAPACEKFGFANDWSDPENMDYFSDNISTSNEIKLEVFALKKTGRIIGWVSNKDHYWYNMAGSVPCPSCLDACFKDYSAAGDIGELSGDSINIHGIDPGTFRIEWWSTHYFYDIDGDGAGDTGGLIWQQQVTTKSNKITFAIPLMKETAKGNSPYTQDYAFKVILLAPQKK